MTTSSRGALVLLLGAIALTTGCEVGPDDGPSARPPKASEVSDVAFPLDGFVPDRRELRAVDRARTELMDQCVDRFTGKRYVPETAVGFTPAFSHDRFGLVDPEVAAKLGYHDPADELGVVFARKHPVTVPDGKPTPTWIVDGVTPGTTPVPVDPGGKALPPGGCSSEVDALLHETPAAKVFVDREIQDIERAEKDDPRVARAIESWVSCMHDHGFTYESPLGPALDFTAAVEPSSREIEVATTDADCRVSTGYLDTRVDVLSDVQSRSLKDHGSEWRAYRDWMDRRIESAEAVLELAKTQKSTSEAADAFSK